VKRTTENTTSLMLSTMRRASRILATLPQHARRASTGEQMRSLPTSRPSITKHGGRHYYMSEAANIGDIHYPDVLEGHVLRMPVPTNIEAMMKIITMYILRRGHPKYL